MEHRPSYCWVEGGHTTAAVLRLRQGKPVMAYHFNSAQTEAGNVGNPLPPSLCPLHHAELKQRGGRDVPTRSIQANSQLPTWQHRGLNSTAGSAKFKASELELKISFCRWVWPYIPWLFQWQEKDFEMKIFLLRPSNRDRKEKANI